MPELTEKLLNEIVRRLVEALAPEEIYLFGSHVSGTPDTDSDVDLLVVVGDGNADVWEASARGRRSLLGIGVPIDLVVCTSQQVRTWCSVPSNIIHTVSEKGRRVYAA